MKPDSFVGTRIRERRQIAGLRQADLARRIGISASYLNLIEHNRRRIGGKVLLRIAEALGVEPSILRDGAEAALLGALRQAVADFPEAGAELDRVEELTGRFPGWAALVEAAHARVQSLERTVEGLQDRLAHDPELEAALHDVLTTAASIRSTASILVETDALEVEWLNRFHGNINEDSARLADSSRALVAYLGQEAAADTDRRLPQEEVEAFLAERSFYIPQLEAPGGSVAAVVAESGLTPAAQRVLEAYLTGYHSDAQALPMAVLQTALDGNPAPDPLALAQACASPIGLVLRRLASVPGLTSVYGLCDRSGAFLLRKEAPGFTFPRLGAVCPLLPIFQALGQPGVVVRESVTQLGAREAKFSCYALAEPAAAAGYNRPPLVQAAMLLLPDQTAGDAALPVGTTCRICARTPCPARREAVIL